jgi:membrane-bound lytic murein transglycosylase B
LPQSADPGWVATIAGKTGIPSRAMSAYADAELAMRTIDPGCHLSWNMLAGIGLVESNHGGTSGAVLLTDGSTSIRILGPALDGHGGTRAIPATPEGVRLDGDTRWDHAVGPMQFLPSTWTKWGRTTHARSPDPNNIDDAALTAAYYLCAGGRDLSTPSGWRAGIGSYNSPDFYDTLVTAAANRYARASLT